MTYPWERPDPVVGAAVLGIITAVLDFIAVPFLAVMRGGPVDVLQGIGASLVLVELLGGILLLSASFLILKRTGWQLYVIASSWHFVFAVPFLIMGVYAGLAIVPLPLLGLLFVTRPNVRRWFPLGGC